MTINVNGITLYYEKTGRGEPLILLHGNGEDHTIFDVVSKQLSQKYTVYAIDSRNHGKSEKTAELHYEDMADDVTAFIRELQIERPILYGFSDGGIIGLLIAINHPEMLSKLAISGVNINPNGIVKRWIAIMKFCYFFTRNSRLKLMLTEPNIKPSDLQKINTPTYILAGSNDMIYEEHTKLIADNIPHSVLRILQGEKHASYVIKSEKLYPILLPFLEADPK